MDARYVWWSPTRPDVYLIGRLIPYTSPSLISLPPTPGRVVAALMPHHHGQVAVSGTSFIGLQLSVRLALEVRVRYSVGLRSFVD